MQVEVGCGRITWGPDAAEESVLAEIARAGYAGASWSLRDDRSPLDTAKLYESYRLRPAPGYFGADFWEKTLHDEIVASARRYARASRELGLTELYVSAGGFDRLTRAGRTRRQAAGHVTADDSLSDREFADLADGLEAVGTATLEEGVRICYHNHVGSVIETEDEVERVLATTDPDVVALGPDTGHLAWAGVDVLEFCRRHAGRIRTMHIKDVNMDVRREGVVGGWDYGMFQHHGIWAEPGGGSIDFASVLRILDGADFQGWVVVETDVTQKPSAFESAALSRSYLRELGL